MCGRLQQSFYRVGPEMAPYMLCDWQLWLWKENKSEVFDTFKLDQFHKDFVGFANKRHCHTVIPQDRPGFLNWWHGFYPDLPPRLANEAMWLAVENGLVARQMNALRELPPKLKSDQQRPQILQRLALSKKLLDTISSTAV